MNPEAAQDPLPAAVPPGKGDLRAGALLCLGFLLIYLRTLCPTVYLGDSGEITTAIVKGGIIHPPGYPLFSLLGGAALSLVPFGEPAYRIGCLVALFAALAVGVLYFVLRETGASRWASVISAAVFGASFTLWSQSTRVEVYSLHVLLALTALLGALRYRRTGCLGFFVLGFLAASLGLAHHLTIVLVGPAMLVLAGPRLWSDPGRGMRLALLGVLALVGPSFYLLLLHRARQEPPHAWGQPDNFALLWNHVSARLYQGAFKVPTLKQLGPRLTMAAYLFVDNFPWFGFPLAAVKDRHLYQSIVYVVTAVNAAFLVWGGRALWNRDRTLALTAAGSVLLVVAWNQCYGIADIAPYYLFGFAVVTLFVAAALDRGHRLIVEYPKATRLAGLVTVALVGYPLLRNWGPSDLSRAIWVREFARTKLECADPNAILISGEDPDTFPLWYVHEVLGVRPDVLHLEFGLLLSAWTAHGRDPSLWYVRQLRREGLDLPLTVPADRDTRIRMGKEGHLLKLILKQFPERPFAMTFLSTGEGRNVQALTWIRANYTAVPQGLLLSLVPKDRNVDVNQLLARNREIWSRIDVPKVQEIRTDQEFAPDYVAGHYACMLLNYGGLYERTGQLEQARAIYALATQLAPRYQEAADALAAAERALAASGKG